jgi:hemerythrin-like domain-containing protein
MPVSIPLLRRDHVHFSLVLDMLDRQADALERGSRTAVPLLIQGLKYFREYPCKVHHPKEDLIYGFLKRRMVRGVEHLFNALEEHAELHNQLAAVAAAARSLDGKDRAGVTGFCSRLHEFTARERRHIENEEAHLYPSAVHLLTPEDWKSISEAGASEKDPIFSDAVSDKFDHLIADILMKDAASRGMDE